MVNEIACNPDYVAAQSIVDSVHLFIGKVNSYLTKADEGIILSEGDGASAIADFYRRTKGEKTDLVNRTQEISGKISAANREVYGRLEPRLITDYLAALSRLYGCMWLLNLGTEDEEHKRQLELLKSISPNLARPTP